MKELKSFVFRFSGVEVREREFSLVKDGETLTVEPKAFRVLVILLQTPQKLVTKEHLMNAVWGDAAVTENSLTRCISMLRKALGDNAGEPRFIATVATVSYRMVCDVEICEDEGEATHGLLRSIRETNEDAPGSVEKESGHAATTGVPLAARIESTDTLSESISEAKVGKRKLGLWWIVGASVLTAGVTSVTW